MYNIKKKQDFLRTGQSFYRKSRIYENILETIGHTPLVKLNRIPEDHGLECEIYVKCEFMNPGGSIKDRIAYTMMLEAEESGRVNPDTRFVEPTSGNTGIGIALATAVHGYRCTIVTPDKNSDEKMNTINLLGAEIVQTPAEAAHENVDNFMSVFNKVLRDDSHAISLDQYSNNMNPLTHYENTATEILSAVSYLDMIVMGTGTGGTAAGIGRRIKERCPNCVVVAVDPQGSVMFEEGTPKQYFVEGIGGDFIPGVLDKTVINRVEKPDDSQSFNMAREIIRKEGILCGGSSGAAMYSAIKTAKEMNLGPGKRVVVILPDGIRNYMTKFVSDQWMEAHLFKPLPERRQISWWAEPISKLKINTSLPHIDENKSCWDALSTMGSRHQVALVINQKGFLRGVISKDSIRHEATNPKKGGRINMDEPICKHLVKQYYKIIENKVESTIGLVSRMLDIAPYVVVVETYELDKEVLLPKGLVTADHVISYITEKEKITDNSFY